MRGSPGPHPGQKLRGLGGGKLRGIARGSPGPHPGGKLRDLAGGFRPTHRGEKLMSLAGGPGGVIPACTEADTPQQTTTAVVSTHPTGMHSSWIWFRLG